ncbi:VanZ family protein [Serpentinicella sp. ANB-PHB4]|uniref:VanZ family protein n=1 Tax=Serpentinicella sp. ANB-PHB4 TaxID=3074076 RepID=UPI00285CED34|nr:VanZ family protein [Serpentinicella sp. ANB-PHB4]MDR5658953.1 VanZ family protein [Serpentinicella sp. ANB-PHB4]
MKLKSWFILLFFIGLVFYLSSIPGLQVLPLLKQLNSLLGSLDLSLVRFSEWLASIIPLNFNELGPFRTVSEDFLLYANDNPAIIEFVLRKIAHVIMFFFITIAFFLLASQYTKKPRNAIIIAFLGGTTMSFLDEYRQSFVPTRVASLMDVFINFIGVSIAIMVILFALFITKSARIQEYYYKNFRNKNNLAQTEQKDQVTEDAIQNQDTQVFDTSFSEKVKKED